MSKEIIVIFNNIASYNKDQYLLLILSLLISYLIGSISPSTIISKYKGIDIKNSGSGNAGTTNVLRLMGIKAARVTLGIDIIKGMIAVKVGMGLVDFNTAALCSIAVVLGHIFPIFYKFKGGKGVATAFGAVLMINWPSALAALILVILTVGISKKMSLGSLVGAISYPLLILYYFPRIFIFGSILALTLVLTHLSNIKRLIKKEENAISVANPEEKSVANPEEKNEKKEIKDIKELKVDSEINNKKKAGSFEKATDETYQKENDEEIPKNYFDEKEVPILKPKDKRKIAFIGINKYLLSIANIMAYNGHNVMVFGEDKALISKLRDTNMVEEEFPDIKLSSNIQYTYHIMTAANKRHIIVINGRYEKLKDLLSKISKKADKNTLIINLIDNNNDFKNITEEEVKKIIKDNPYLELSYKGDYKDLIMNKKADLFVIKDNNENIDEVIKTLGSQKINIISNEQGSKN